MEEDKCKVLEEFKESIKNYSSPEMIKLEEALFKKIDTDIEFRKEKICIVQDLFYKRFVHNSIHC